MVDLTPALLPPLKAYRLPGLELGDGIVYPGYDGHSILNVPSGICRLFGIPGLESLPLASEVLDPLGERARVVILVVIDGLALYRLQRWMEAGEIPALQRLVDRGLMAPLTSVVPSTTAAALTSLWTGAPPSRHGILGYEMWLKEYGVVANMVEHRPITYLSEGSLQYAGFDPLHFLPVGTLGPHFSRHGIEPHAFQHYSIINSGLSQMFMPEVKIHGFQTSAELWLSMRQLLETKSAESMFIWTYWGVVDGLSHKYHPDDEHILAELKQFGQAFEQFLLDELNPAGRKDVVVLMTADHGHITTNPEEPHYQAGNHPELIDKLHMLPTGENRLSQLFVKPGQLEAVREYIQRAWPDQAVVLDSEHALRQGLFGPGEPYQKVHERIGDLLVVWRDDAYLWWTPNKNNNRVGRHGGLSPEEMLVPLVGARLG